MSIKNKNSRNIIGTFQTGYKMIFIYSTPNINVFIYSESKNRENDSKT